MCQNLSENPPTQCPRSERLIENPAFSLGTSRIRATISGGVPPCFRTSYTTSPPSSPRVGAEGGQSDSEGGVRYSPPNHFYAEEG